MKFWDRRQQKQPRSTGGCRLYAIGDVHGCFGLLVELLQMIERDQSCRPAAETHVLLLGDYIDRGPQSRDVCELLHAMAPSPYFHCLRGNHEQTMLDVLDGNRMALRFWLDYGGAETLASWGLEPELIERARYGEAGENRLINAFRSAIPATLPEWLRALPAFRVHGDYLFVHAGIRPGLDLDRQSEDDLLWIREPFLSSKARHPWRIVHGHSEGDEVQIMPGRIGIDTAAYRTGVLTALGVEGDRHWTIQTGSGAKADQSRDLAGDQV